METPDFTALQNVTYTAFADMDASPTKAWLITHRNEAQWKWYYELAFAKRQGEELYDVRKARIGNGRLPSRAVATWRSRPVITQFRAGSS